MSVRNFWVDGQVDGRSTHVEGGPRSKDGGFNMTVYIRDEGGIERAVTLNGRALSSGELVLDVSPGDDLARDAKIEGTANGGFRVTTKR